MKVGIKQEFKNKRSILLVTTTEKFGDMTMCK